MMEDRIGRDDREEGKREREDRISISLAGVVDVLSDCPIFLRMMLICSLHCTRLRLV
jgi:hypothetical protein